MNDVTIPSDHRGGLVVAGVYAGTIGSKEEGGEG